MAAGCGESAEMMASAAAMVLVSAVAGLGRLGGGSGRCLGPPLRSSHGHGDPVNVESDRGLLMGNCFIN